MTTDEFKSFLKKRQLKATPQRIAVHEAMRSLVHASADMVTAHIMENTPVRITVASVYNILLSMAGLGLYSQRMSATNKMFFDVDRTSHIHLYDTVGNEYRDIVDEELMTMVTERLGKKKFRGYKVDGIDIQILCHPGRKRKSKI